MAVFGEDLDKQQAEGAEDELSDQPTERPAGSARGLDAANTTRQIAKGAQNLAKGVGGKAVKLATTVFGPGSKIKIGIIVIDLGVYLLALILFLIGLTTMSLGNSGQRGTTPEQQLDLSQPSTLSDLQAIQCLQEEANQPDTEDATIGEECAQQIRSAVERMRSDIESLRKRVSDSDIESKLDAFETQLERLTQLTKLSELQKQKSLVDDELQKLNAELSKAGIAGGLSSLAGREASTKLSRIRVTRNKQVLTLEGEGGITLASARIGIGDGSGDGGNYLKTSGFFNGDHTTPLGSFQTGYRERNANGVYSGQFGSNMGKEVIEYTGGVATGRGLLFHSGPAVYDLRNPLPFTYGCVRLTSTDMRILYDIVSAQGKNVPVEITDR